MNIREAIDRVQALYSKGAASDDTRLSKRHIYSKLKSARALLLRREYNKYKKLSDRNIEYLECVRMIKAEPYECPCVPPTGFQILKSGCEIPRPISSTAGAHIASVTSLDGSYIFSPTTWEEKKYKAGNKYTSGTLDYFFKNGYLYITSRELIPAVTVAGIFEDSESFNCDYCCDEDLYPKDCTSLLDKEFKVDAHLMEPIVQLAVEELINIFAKIPEDKENDSTDR